MHPLYSLDFRLVGSVAYEALAHIGPFAQVVAEQYPSDFRLQFWTLEGHWVSSVWKSLLSPPSSLYPTHCLIFRTGGTVNFRWQRTLGMTLEEAIRVKEETWRMGYLCYIERLDRSLAIGLPETYAPSHALPIE